MKKLFYPVFALVVFITSCKKEVTVQPVRPYNPDPVVVDSLFTNPLLPSGPDPWVVKKDSFYYYTSTNNVNITLWKTKAVSDLKNAPKTIVWRPPASGPNAVNIWAPEMHFINNKWYIYYTAGRTTDFATQRMFVLENTNPDPTQGTWTDLGEISDPTISVFSLDATIFEHNNKLYLIYSSIPNAANNNQHLYIARLKNPYQMETSRIEISQPTLPWEVNGAPPAVNEGPEILRGPTGKIFMVYSASGCWTDDYALGMLTLKDNGDPLNPADWVKNPTPVFTKAPGNNAFGPGHNAFFKSADGKEDWILYHANAVSNQGCGDTRTPRIQKFNWNADGTPNFGIPVKTGVSFLKPSGEF